MNRTVSRETSDTIVAIATPPGRGGIGVVRASGPASSRIRDEIAGSGIAERAAVYRRFLDVDGELMDRGVTIFFRGPSSYTGEDVIEFQCHGGQAVLNRLLDRCVGLGCRIARPGEFTERAFLNGKLDLAQAEGVADLIEASSVQAARSAARTLSGEFSARVNLLVEMVTTLRMHIEARIDFPEDELNLADQQAIANQLENIRVALRQLRAAATMGAVLRDGLVVVLIGGPNVGKSSLLNRLAGDEVAIVTPVAGTTRDTVKATVHLNGVPIHLVDTAGLRETDDPVESIGIQRSWGAIEGAGAALLVVEAECGAGEREAGIIRQLPPTLPIAVVHNKIDLSRTLFVSRETSRTRVIEEFAVSALTGEGVDALRAWLVKASGWIPLSDGVFLARARHLAALESAERHLESAESLDLQFDLFAEEMRLAQLELSSITGKFTPDDLLGEIFGRFCIGK